MIKRMGVLAFIFSVWISMVIPGVLIAQEVPSPPCAGCGGVPTTPKPFMVIPPSPLINPVIPNALEYDGTNLWLTDKSGNRGSVFSGNAPSTFNNTVTFGSSGVLDFTTGSVINFADGSVWKATGLIFGSGTSLSFPDGSAWDSSGLIFGTSGTETLPDGSAWTSSGLTFGSGSITKNAQLSSPVLSGTITNNGTITGGTVSGSTLSGTLAFNPASIPNPMPDQKIYYTTPTNTSIQLTVPPWAKWITADVIAGGGGGNSATYTGGGGGYVHAEFPLSQVPSGDVICITVGSGGAAGSPGTTGSYSYIYIASTCAATVFWQAVAIGGNGGSGTANGTQGGVAFTNNTNIHGLIYYNLGQAGCGNQQPAYTLSSSMCSSTTINFGTGGSINSAGAQGIIIVSYN